MAPSAKISALPRTRMTGSPWAGPPATEHGRRAISPDWRRSDHQVLSEPEVDRSYVLPPPFCFRPRERRALSVLIRRETLRRARRQRLAGQSTDSSGRTALMMGSSRHRRHLPTIHGFRPGSRLHRRSPCRRDPRRLQTAGTRGFPARVPRTSFRYRTLGAPLKDTAVHGGR